MIKKRKRGRPRKPLCPPKSEPKGEPKGEPANSNDLEDRLHQEFTAGLRYALAKYWDYIEIGGNTYLLERAYQEAMRCERGERPPEIIDTNRGSKVGWEAEFDMLRRRFKRRTELPDALIDEVRRRGEGDRMTLVPRGSDGRHRKQQVEWTEKI